MQNVSYICRIRLVTTLATGREHCWQIRPLNTADFPCVWHLILSTRKFALHFAPTVSASAHRAALIVATTSLADKNLRRYVGASRRPPCHNRLYCKISRTDHLFSLFCQPSETFHPVYISCGHSLGILTVVFPARV